MFLFNFFQTIFIHSPIFYNQRAKKIGYYEQSAPVQLATPVSSIVAEQVTF